MLCDISDEDHAVCVPGETLCGTVWWSRLARAIRRDPLGWAAHACIAGGSWVTMLCCMLYAGGYLGQAVTIFVSLCDASQCIAYYVWHRDTLRRNCFESSVSWLNRMMFCFLYPIPVGFKLATPWLVTYATDPLSAVGAAGVALIYHWTMYVTTELCVWDEARHRGGAGVRTKGRLLNNYSD